MPGVQAQIYVSMHVHLLPQTVDGTRVLELAPIIYDDHGSTMERQSVLSRSMQDGRVVIEHGSSVHTHERQWHERQVQKRS